MSIRGRRSFIRPLGTRRYRKMFVIAVEGAKTEPQYFDIFKATESIIHIECLRGQNDSSPPQVLARMEYYLKKNEFKPDDEAWLVVDRDQWTDRQLNELHRWTIRKANHRLALSNPNFEFWLLLHFDDGNNVTSSQGCVKRLKRYIRGYNKNIDIHKFDEEKIKNAIKRAKQKDNPPCKKWPQNTGTTVYRLVESIYSSSN